MGSGLDASLSLQLGPGPLAAPLPEEAAANGDKTGPITCVHCQQVVSPAELRLAIQCGRPACSRYAHALCAVEQGYAGVLEASALDGQYLCWLCGTKSDLLPYWKERLAAAATGEGLALGQHLGLAARLLHKTRRAEVEAVQAQVEYAVAQLVAGQDADIIAKLLRQLASEADRVAPGRPTDAAGSAAVSAASPPWPRSDGNPPAMPASGSGGKVERDFLVCLRTASSGLERARPVEAPLLEAQAALTLGRPKSVPAWGPARVASVGPTAGEHPQGSDAQLVAAERLADLTRTLQAAVEDAQAETLRLKAQAEADLRRAHAAREEASTAEGAARRALEEAAAQEGVARASIAAAQRAADKVQQMSARGEAQLEALRQELDTARGLCAPSEPVALPFTQPSKGTGTAGGAGSLYGENLESSLRSQLKMAKLLDSLRAADRQRAEERRHADQLRFKKAPSLTAGVENGLPKGDDAGERKGGLLAALRAEPAGGVNGERAAADAFLMLSSGGGSTPQKRGRPSEGADQEAGGLLGFAAKVSRSSSRVARASGEEGADGKEPDRGSAVLAQARDFLTEMHRESLPPGAGRMADGGGEAALAAERSIKDAELVMRAELAVLQNLVPALARQFGERKFRVLVIAALARQWDGTWRLCLTRRKGKGFRLQLPMCGLDAGLDLLGEERPDTLPLARKLARDCLGETPDTVLLSSPAGYDTPVIYKEEQKDGSLTMALIHPLVASPADAPIAHPGTSYHHGDTFVSWCRADALVPVVRDVPQKFSATFPRVLKCLELLMSNPLDGWPLPALLKLGVQAPDVLG